jgi:hypothetical protein
MFAAFARRGIGAKGLAAIASREPISLQTQQRAPCFAFFAMRKKNKTVTEFPHAPPRATTISVSAS